MKTMTIAVLAALGALAACGQKPETTVPAAASGVADAAGASTGKMVKGVGVVTAVDAKAGTVTLDHQAIPAAGWPAMTMAFSASADVVAKARPGETFGFDLRINDQGGTIVRLERQ